MTLRFRFIRLLALSFGFVLLTSIADAQQGYDIDMDWAELPEGGWDGATSWVAADGKGQVVVMVRSAPYFRVFARDGKFIRSWGQDPAFRNAHSITFDEAGNMWATDAGNHVIYQFSPQGELLQTLGKSGEAGDNSSTTLFNQPNHVALAPDGDLYISDGYVNARIVQVAPDGTFRRIIGGSEGAAAGQLKLPHGIALDSQGRLLINDSDNKRISVFNTDGSFAETWPFASRGGIAVTDDDTVYISDVNEGTINIVRGGKLIDSIKVDARPHGLALDSDGAIYVSDSLGRKVIKITRK